MIDKKYQWDLSFIYKDEASFDADLERIKAIAKELPSYEGHLSDEEKLASYLRLEKEAELTRRIMLEHRFEKGWKPKPRVKPSVEPSR